MIFMIGASFAFFLALILISKKGKSLADKMLVAWMLVLGTHLGINWLDVTGLDQTYHFLLGIGTPFPLIHGPLLFLYARFLTSEKERMDWKEYLHFLPALLVILRMLPFLFSSGEEKLSYIQDLAEHGSLFMTLVLYSYMVSGITYVTLSLLILRTHRARLTTNFSYTEQINLNWLRNLILGMIVVWSIVIIGHTLDDVFTLNIEDEVDTLIYSSLTLFTLMIGYFGIKQTRIFSGHIPVDTSEPEEIVEKTAPDEIRYRKSGLKSEQADELQARLEEMMLTEKPYLDHTLTLTRLAENLAIHPNYLSQLINERFQRNFYDFINSARIEEFKTLAQQPQSKQFTLVALAYECGFSSKSSFNKFFKKSTGTTPSEFMRSQIS